MLVSSPDGLVVKEEFEEIMSVRGRHVETSKEQVAIVVYNGHVAVEEVHEVVHKEAGKLDGDQIWAQIAWALLVVNFILWLCVQVILRKIRLSAVFFLFPGVFLMLSNGNRWHEQLSAYSKHCAAKLYGAYRRAVLERWEIRQAGASFGTGAGNGLGG